MAEQKIYYVYIVASRSRTIYVGITSEIEIRVLQHRNGTYEGFTKRYRCHRLVLFERFGFVENAIAREKELKGWKREKKIALIERENPTWVDLSADWGKPVAMYDWSAEAERKQVLRFAQDDTSSTQGKSG